MAARADCLSYNIPHISINHAYESSYTHAPQRPALVKIVVTPDDTPLEIDGTETARTEKHNAACVPLPMHALLDTPGPNRLLRSLHPSQKRGWFPGNLRE